MDNEFFLNGSRLWATLNPQDDAWEFDFNGNGFIDYSDIIEMLALQPSPTELGVYEEK